MERLDLLRMGAVRAACACALLVACSAPPPPPEPREAPQEAEAPRPYDVDEEGRFPPPPIVPARAALAGSDTLQSENTAPSPIPAAEAASQTTPAPEIRAGFRVQVAACADLESAHAVQREIRASAALPVYVVHEPPYYKVRVGDCASEAECRALESRLRADGWQSAWLVRTQIVSH